MTHHSIARHLDYLDEGIAYHCLGGEQIEQTAFLRIAMWRTRDVTLTKQTEGQVPADSPLHFLQ